jgi:hypothetical protein
VAQIGGALAGGGADEDEAQTGLQLVGELFQCEEQTCRAG